MGSERTPNERMEIKCQAKLLIFKEAYTVPGDNLCCPSIELRGVGCGRPQLDVVVYARGGEQREEGMRRHTVHHVPAHSALKILLLYEHHSATRLKNSIPKPGRRLVYDCILDYSDFHTLMGFTSKKRCQIIFFKMFVKKVFPWVKISCEFAFYYFQKILIYPLYSMTPNFFFLI
jgi:hypothetical protein